MKFSTHRTVRVFLLFGVFVVTACSAEKSSNIVIKNDAGNAPIGDATTGGTGGHNEPISGSSGGVPVSGSGASAAGSSGATGGSAGTDDEICAEQDVQVTRIIPWVLFVIDRSSSMSEYYPGSTNRWQAVYDALMDANEGVIARLHEVVRFGIMLFDGEGPCPRLVTVDPEISNYDAINSVYGTTLPGLRTPTALALAEAYKRVPNQSQVELETVKAFVVLCTDGEPNGCPVNDEFAPTDFDGPKDEVTAATAQGIQTYVVSVASGGQQYQDFLDQLAVIGNTGSPAFSPATKEDLVARFTDIVGGAIGCEVELNGKVTEGNECLGTVVLNGDELECNGPDGWRLSDESHIELLGQACERFKFDPSVMLEADFPCGVIELI